MDESDTKYTKRLLLGAALIFAALVFALIEIETVITGVVVLFLWGWWDRRRMRKLSIQFEFARTYGTAPWADSALGDLEAAGEAADHHRWSREEYFEKLRQEIANPSPELRGTPEDVLTEMLGPECLFTMGEMRDVARDCRDGKGYDAAALAATIKWWTTTPTPSPTTKSGRATVSRKKRGKRS